MIKKIWLLSFAIALGLQMQAQRQDDMRQTVEYLASQELGGRYPATHGDTLASEFIVSQLRSMKLKPVVKGKKVTGYYHDFTYGKNEKRTTHNIIAVIPGKDKRLKNEYIVVGSHYDHLGARAVPTRWAFIRVPTTMPAAMLLYSSWLVISRRQALRVASSSPSSEPRNRGL